MHELYEWISSGLVFQNIFDVKAIHPISTPTWTVYKINTMCGNI